MLGQHYNHVGIKARGGAEVDGIGIDVHGLAVCEDTLLRAGLASGEE